jgi:transcriptional regulator with XRE-family HTH domain
MAEWRNEGVKQFWADVAKRLKLARHLRNITEQQAADAMLVTLPTYRRWERGERHRDNLYGVLNFCGNYGISYPWLFGSDEYEAVPPRFKLRQVG